MSAKEFEQECYEVIKDIDGVQSVELQGCCKYTHKGTRYCPDIVGIYQAEQHKPRKGFVVDCKHYSSETSIGQADCKKLERDVDETRKYLIEKKKIGASRSIVQGIFITSEGRRATAEEQFTVITVGKPGLPYWKENLKRGFTGAMS